MTQDDRKQKIESFGKGFNAISETLKNLPKEMWKFKPSPKEWSVHEIIIHLADSEANSYIRCRRFIAETGNTVMAYDQDLWANKLNYHDQNPDDALELFRLLRVMTYNMIKDLPEKTWANVIYHPENGLMSMDEWLNIYEEHPYKHAGQMKRNFEKWRKVEMSS